MPLFGTAVAPNQSFSLFHPVILGSYILWMILWRNKGFMRFLDPVRKANPSW